ncbi:hypothetical protein F5X99DRAFT_399096 [Biscogniauxia marginata]|nr:hypothetical protein F5X99DRAFT_399096 [Biscogniauxia marginata]
MRLLSLATLGVEISFAASPQRGRQEVPVLATRDTSINGLATSHVLASCFGNLCSGGGRALPPFSPCLRTRWYERPSERRVLVSKARH